jgi:hypothetical protein
MRRRAIWLGGALAILVVGVGTSLYQHQSIPDRVQACGREYGHKDGTAGAGPFTLAELRQREGVDLAKRTTAGRYEVWAHPRCGLGVFLRTDRNRFLGYGLLGGP